MRRLTELKTYLEQTNMSDDALRGVFAFNPYGLQVFKRDGTPLFSNEAFRLIFGKNLSPTYNILKDVRLVERGLDKIIERCFLHKETVQTPPTWLDLAELEKTQKKEFSIAFEATFFPIIDEKNEITLVCTIFRDVSREVKFSEEIKETNFLWETVGHRSRFGTWTSDLEMDKLFWSKPMYEIFGIEPGKKLTFQEFTELVHIEDRQKLFEAHSKAIQESGSFEFVHRISHPTRGMRWIKEQAEVFLDQNGKPTRILGISHDVTENYAEKQRFQITEERYQKLLQSDGLSIFLADLDGRIYNANESFLNMIGYTQDELKNGLVTWDQMTPPEHRHLDEQAADCLIRTGSCPAYRKEFIRKDGTRITVVVGGALVQTGGTEVISYAIDFTKTKDLEQQLLQSQKMEALGRFAGGIAHDFNNILAVVLLTADQSILELKLSLDEKRLHHHLKVIKDSAARGARLTHQILAFSRKQVFEIINVNLVEVVSDMESMLRRLVPENIKIQIHFDVDKAIVKADRSQIEQCILNLVVNAKDAMPEGGQIHIEVTDKDNCYILNVLDNGIGMDQHTLKNVFEPFFTTKEKGKGSGLGLATVFGIVKQMGGDIKVSSQLGKGASFSLFLPASAEKNVKFRQPPIEVSDICGDGCTILLVEDEALLRKATADILEISGFKVLQAGNGKEALSIFKKEKIDLVVTDVIMPEMTGPSLIQELEEATGKAMAVLYLSGYTWDELEKYGLNHESSFFMEKPYDVSALLKMVGMIDKIRTK